MARCCAAFDRAEEEGVAAGDSMHARSDSVAGLIAVPVNSSQRAKTNSCLSPSDDDWIGWQGIMLGSRATELDACLTGVRVAAGSPGPKHDRKRLIASAHSTDF